MRAARSFAFITVKLEAVVVSNRLTCRSIASGLLKVHEAGYMVCITGA